MTDGNQEPAIEAYERRETVRQWRETAERHKAEGVDPRVLEAQERGLVGELAKPAAPASPPPPWAGAAVAVQPARPATPLPPPDPDAALRHARLAVTAAIVLALLLLYLRRQVRAAGDDER